MKIKNIISIMLIIFILSISNVSQAVKNSSFKPNKINNISRGEDTRNELPENLKYKEINKNKLYKYLFKRKSALQYEPYFATIIYIAKDNNLNPLVLFAIAGQEQQYCPIYWENCWQMINNPYNIKGSWKEYNTNIEDSTNIACKTLINLLKNYPDEDEIDVFEWINYKWAEDTTWHEGVKNILKELERITYGQEEN